MIPTSEIARVVESTDLIQLVNQYLTRPLRRSGAQYLGYCCFHKERSPSFVVHPDKQLFHCKGCGVGGNAINFVERIERVGFVEAVRMLADRAGVELHENDAPARDGYAAMIAAECAWWWGKVLRAYRDREILRWKFFDLYLIRSRAMSDLDIRFHFLSEAVRCRRSALRWHRILDKAESLDKNIVLKKYYSYRSKHPEAVLEYREEQALNAEVGRVYREAVRKVASEEALVEGLVVRIASRLQ